MNQHGCKRIRWLLLSALAICQLPAAAAGTADLTLADSIQMALNNNHSIKESAIDLESAQWKLAEAVISKGMTVSWSSSAERLGGGLYENVDYNREFANALEASLPVYTSGKLESQIKSSRYGVEATAFTTENERQRIRELVATDYFTILKYRSDVQVYEDSVRDLKEHLRVVNAKFANGTVSKSDVLSSEVSLANSQQNLVSSQNNYSVGVATLNNDMGLPTNYPTNVKDELAYIQYDLSLERCIDYALVHRPDAQAKKSEVLAYAADVDSVRAEDKPQVSLIGKKAIGGSNLFSDNHNSSNSWLFGVSASWSIFDNGVTRAKVKQKEATLRKAREIALEQDDTVRLEVCTAYMNLITAEKNIHTAQESVVKAKHDYTIEQVRYSSGVSTNLDILDSENKLRQAESNYVTALYDYNTSKAALDKAMGIPIGSVVKGGNEIVDKG